MSGAQSLVGRLRLSKRQVAGDEQVGLGLLPHGRNLGEYRLGQLHRRDLAVDQHLVQLADRPLKKRHSWIALTLKYESSRLGAFSSAASAGSDGSRTSSRITLRSSRGCAVAGTFEVSARFRASIAVRMWRS